jgi:hypothetical protein
MVKKTPKTLNTLKTPHKSKVYKVPRYSVNIIAPVEAKLQEARGKLMALKRRDVDKTRAFNVFLAWGVIYFLAKLENNALDEKELQLFDAFLDIDMDIDSMEDEINTVLLKKIEKGEAEIRKKETK